MQQCAGAWPVMVTPYDDGLNIDHGAYKAMVEWYLAQGVGGIYANCLSGDMYLLDADERLSLVAETVAAVKGRVPVAATGNLGRDFAEHVTFAQRVAAAGADVVMLVVPEFCDRDEDLLVYYLALAERVDAPLGLYECPVPRHFHLSVDLVARLAHTGRFVAFKETSCDIHRIRAHVAACAGTPLALLQANAPYLLEAVRAGAPGTMSIATNWVPDLVRAVIDCAQAGDPSAESLQAHLSVLEMVERGVHPLGLRYLLRKRGVPVSPHSRAGLAPLAPEVTRALDDCWAQWFRPDGTLNL
jgi:4-hydroxy-tetrahydrodipicolinate synthase